MGRVMKSCTVVIAPEGETCGKPAVATFTGRNGEPFAECRDHEVRVPEKHRFDYCAGDPVTITYNGQPGRPGQIVSVGTVNCTVQIELRDGRTKNVSRPIDEVVPTKGYR